jgi:hypothetical protein
MKDTWFVATVIGCIIAGLLIIAGVMFSMRQFSLAVTSVDVIDVEPGVRCARMVTADGAAISCWKVEQ